MYDEIEFYGQHEAGHFLIAYLVGILPRGYTVSSVEALKKEGSLNVQAGTTFVDFEFVEEVRSPCPLSFSLHFLFLDNSFQLCMARWLGLHSSP